MLCELLSVVIAAAVWGPEWRNSVVVFQCDNKGAVSAINFGYSRVQGILHLLRCIFFIRAHYGIHIRAVHILGNKNVLANAISRDNLLLLFSLILEAASGHIRVPQDLVEVLVNKQVQWTSASWCQQFKNCLRLVQQTPPRGYIAKSGDKCYNDFCNIFRFALYPVTETQLSYLQLICSRKGYWLLQLKVIWLQLGIPRLFGGWGTHISTRCRDCNTL